MFTLAINILLHNRSRLLLTIGGVTVAVFLTAAQVGLLVGWCKTNSAIIRHCEVDVWVMAEQTPSFDYGTPIPRNRLYQVRNVPGVAWSQAMFTAFNFLQRPDGRRVSVTLVGVDDDLVGAPWQMKEQRVDLLHLPDSIIVDELYLADLGVAAVDDELEMMGRRAIVRGISQDVRTFTAAPFVFTSLENAIAFDGRYSNDEVTYVLVRCSPGTSPEEVRNRIASHVPHVDVLTSSEFARRTICYWMLETGVGITVVITAALGLVVGGIIISQTLYAITQEHLSNYAMLLALGFSSGRLRCLVVYQSLMISAAGIVLGSCLFLYAVWLTAATPIPLQTTPGVSAGVVISSLLSGLLASCLSLRSVFQLDPVTVFRA